MLLKIFVLISWMLINLLIIQLQALLIKFINFILTINNVAITEFPTTTDDDMLSRSLVAPAPDQNGFDIGLPLILSDKGLIYDHSQVGKIYAASIQGAEFGELLADGNSYPVN